MPPSCAGLIGAALGYLAALGPSLLPRGLLIEVLGSALVACSGYGVGAVSVALARMAGWRPGPSARKAGWAAAGALWLVAAALTPASLAAVDAQAADLGMPPPEINPVLAVVLTLTLLAVLILLGRLLRAMGRQLDQACRWFVPTGRWSMAVGAMAAFAVCAALAGMALEGTRTAYQALDASQDGQSPPAQDTRSGGPASSVAWDGLGYRGRAFVTGGPTDAQLAAFAGGPVVEPVRAYVGLAQGQTADDRAENAVAELARLGGFARANLIVAIPTGTGWIDAHAIDAAELLLGGDVATVGIQYSYLPSWFSFIADRPLAVASSEAVIDAVLDAVAVLPPDERPRVWLFGESLGAYGGQGALAGQSPAEVVRPGSIDGAVWVGSPYTASLWADWRENRSGGPIWQPDIDQGAVAQAFIEADELTDPPARWQSRRIALVAHPNDPVAWWNGSLVVWPAEWLRDPLGPGVDPALRWWPIATFWRVGLDLARAATTPPGSGHLYPESTADAMGAVLTPDSWNAEVSRRLNAALDALGVEATPWAR
jgi:uncharacterized membrane protein